jgi:hypothetical protein
MYILKSLNEIQQLGHLTFPPPPLMLKRLLTFAAVTFASTSANFH